MAFRFITLFIFVIQGFQAQNIVLTQGKNFSDPQIQLEPIFIGSDDKTNYLLRHARHKTREFKLCSFNNITSELNYEKNIELDKDEILVSQAIASNKIILFTKAKKTNPSRTLFLIRILNASTGAYLMETMVIQEFQMQNEDIKPIEFDAQFSPDSKKMLLILNNKNNIQGKPEVKLYETESFKKIWDKQFHETFEKSNTYPFDFHVDNLGNFIYQIAYYRNVSEKDIGYALCVSPPDNVSLYNIKFPTENKTVIYSNLEFVENQLICNGQFVDGVNKSLDKADPKTIGFFLLKFDMAKFELSQSSFDYFSSELYEKLGNTRPVFKHHRTYIINNEIYEVTFHTLNVYNYYYYYSSSIQYGKEIVVLKYGQDGRLKWMQIIPRNVAKDANILHVICTNKIHLFYSDLQKNLSRFPDITNYDIKRWEPTGGMGKATLTLCVTINSSGKMVREVVRPAESNTHLMKFNAHCIKPNSPLPMRFNYNKRAKIGRMDLLTISD
ncbi:hypothetical protein [Aurantibacillus circumpalustris]|uniref:hypothetical protein n=1 Tax=Aurantibacillus circumpalustris TaxID=3036359 RepID=UPI00295A6063|nr:hypothetical protein [Aurantibacillus circumpalustris]